MTDESSERLARQRRAFALLRELLDLPEPERAQAIASCCGDDDVLASEMHALLAAEHSGVLDRAACDIAARLADEDAAQEDLPSGAHVGAWTIMRPLGSGGMGTVYLAERAGDGYVQQGALKLIKRGMDSAAVLTRFRRERQILSRLVHPNIAHLLDGGVTADGRPYFVMEYIDGETIQHWVARARPNLDARVAVFLSACEAVAYAHHTLIVHRDIKPENLLVDAIGHARLLDFGIAKLLEDDTADERTGTATRFMSRAYAAPEQLRAEAVTTATDIYQLGVLLFELLTGTRFDASPGGAVSTWLVRAHANADDATRLAIPARALHGDVAIIVARATDSEPQRRYPTVEALARDVRAWRNDHPIAARADSAGYRLRRFVSRHRLASAATTLALGAIMAGSTLALWQAREAAKEARLARSAQAFLTSVFDASAPDAAAGERVTARDLLDRGSERIKHELRDQPRLRAEMMLTLGALYRQLGQYPQAEELLSDARVQLSGLAPGSDSAIRAHIEFAATERERGKLDESEQALTAAFAMQPQAGLLSRALAERGLLREKQDHFDAAIAYARAALALDLKRGDSARGDVARDRQVEALMLARRGQFDESARTLEHAIADARAVFGNEDTRIAQMLNDYGLALVEKGRSQEAEVPLRESLVIRRKLLGDQHPAVAESLQLLGAALRPQGRLDESQAALEEALKIQRNAFGDHHVLVANTLNSIGMLGFSRRQPESAEPYFREALAIYRERGESDSAPATAVANNEATVLIQLGRYDEAEPLVRHSLEVHLALVGEQHPFVMSDLNTMAQLEMRRERYDSAIEHARRATRIADSASSPAREGAYVHLSFANVLNRAGRSTEALTEVDRAIATLNGLGKGGGDPRMPVALAVRADALLGLGRTDEAQVLAQGVLAQRENSAPKDAAGMAATHALLARIAAAQHKTADEKRERASARTLLASMTTVDPDLARQVERR
ncbi:MAG: tetratricopeptide repeat protein [Dokdonella sp.]